MHYYAFSGIGPGDDVGGLGMGEGVGVRVRVVVGEEEKRECVGSRGEGECDFLWWGDEWECDFEWE